jgi:cyclopropane fatty-acyl-phospholipid synthase-like methyltransferase
MGNCSNTYETIAHHDRVILGPIGIEELDALLARVTPQPPAHDRARVVDVGCGKGELLVRAMERFGAEGVGVEPNPTFIADARARARGRVAERDLVLFQSTFAAAPLAHGRFDLAVCIGSLHAFGGYAAALVRMAQLVRPRGWGLVGADCWWREPDPAYLAATGFDRDEMQTLERVHEAPATRGWRLIAHHESTQEERDEYERGCEAAVERWLAARPNDSDVPGFRERVMRRHEAYERWGGTMVGFTTMLLRR